MKMIKSLAFAALAGLILTTSFGCSDVEQAFDCTKVCNNVKKCLGTADFDKCYAKCSEDKNKDASKKCADCIETNDSCAENTLFCATQCLSLTQAALAGK